MNPNWYYAKVGQPEQGPFTSAQLKVLALNGQLIATDKVRREDMTDGIFARQIKGLFPPPAVPVPPPFPLRRRKAPFGRRSSRWRSPPRLPSPASPASG